ncbi:MAG: hypothetical protein ABH815_01575 [Candidatus Omnitrophota bacterium]
MADAGAKKKQMEYMAITGLVLIALFVGISRFKKGSVDDEVFSKKKFKEKWKEVEVLEKNIPEEEKGVSYGADSQKIPFKSPLEDVKKIEATEDISLPSMTLQGMIWNSRRPQAIINNKVYEINDIIDTGSQEDEFNVKIADITKEGIYLRYKGKDFLVRPK